MSQFSVRRLHFCWKNWWILTEPELISRLMTNSHKNKWARCTGWWLPPNILCLNNNMASFLPQRRAALRPATTKFLMPFPKLNLCNANIPAHSKLSLVHSFWLCVYSVFVPCCTLCTLKISFLLGFHLSLTSRSQRGIRLNIILVNLAPWSPSVTCFSSGIRLGDSPAEWFVATRVNLA